MSRVRLLVGTRKGAFILTSDGARKSWEISGPHFAGWEIYHLKGAPSHPDRIYASQTSGWFGQLIQRSDDGGKSWEPVDNKFVYEGTPGTHQWYDGTQHPWEFKRVWHLEPSLADPDTVYAGVEDAAMFRTTDGGKSWLELPGLRSAKGHLWQPGAGGMGLHTIVQDPTNPKRLYIAISAAGAFRSDDAGQSWIPINTGLESKYPLPDPAAEVGHCVHRIAMNPGRPGVLFMQKHWDVLRSDDAGGHWREISGDLPTDFGFPIAVHAHEPETVYVVPIKSDSEHYPPDGKLRVYRSRTGGDEWEALTAGLPQRDWWHRVGAADPGAAAGELLRECAPRCHEHRHPGPVRRLLRHDRRTGLRLGRRRRQLDRHRARPARGALGGGPDPGMIRVILPEHLRRLAGVDDEVELDVPAPVTQRTVLDALEGRFPMLRGTTRDHVTQKRRPFIRFFAAGEDLSHEPMDATLPEGVVSGREPFLVVGAIAGG
jgi:photosystem II stability/assembly factor-like uncharacterized protein